jgi:hypothetical protein
MGKKYIYGGLQKQKFRGSDIDVIEITCECGEVGKVTYHLSATKGLISFTVVQGKESARYELHASHGMGLMFFEGRGADWWRALKP